MNVDLTHGSIFRGLLRFSLPLMAGNLLQQLYNLVDTFVVGRYCGEIALAAVGSAFSVMILLTSIVTGLCMGSGVVVSQLFGQKDDAGVRKAVGNAFVLIAGVSALLTILSYALLPVMMALLRIPPEAQGVLSRYLLIVFIGIIPTFLYNFGACMLRAVGNSTAPLVFLLISSLTNVALDFLFVAVLPWGVAGAAVATLISQVLSGFLCLGYVLFRVPALTPSQHDLRPDRALFRRIFSVSAMTSIQQSIMNFGILCVQSLVNSFGLAAMAAFTAGVKIDSLAYSPAQDFGNGFATFVAQNQGANQPQRLRHGIRTAFLLSGGTKGKRFALPNAEIMIHQPLIAGGQGGGLSGQATDIKIHADHIIRTRAKMNRLLSEYTGQPLEKVEQDTERDNFLSAQEAKEYGLIDEVITHR
mgnify:CR=1 FL=1